jgi:hypothetical protein
VVLTAIAGLVLASCSSDSGARPAAASGTQTKLLPVKVYGTPPERFAVSFTKAPTSRNFDNSAASAQVWSGGHVSVNVVALGSAVTQLSATQIMKAYLPTPKAATSTTLSGLPAKRSITKCPVLISGSCVGKRGTLVVLDTANSVLYAVSTYNMDRASTEAALTSFSVIHP